MTVIDNEDQLAQTPYFSAVDACYIANPFSRGQVITIPKGTLITTGSGHLKKAKRTYKVTVRTLPMYGYVNRHDDEGRAVFPRITWSGRGGEWSEAQVSPQLAAANGVQLAEFDLSAEQIETLQLPFIPSWHGEHTDAWTLSD